MSDLLLAEDTDYILLDNEDRLLLDVQPEPPLPPTCNIGLLEIDVDGSLLNVNQFADHLLICFSPTRIVGVSINVRWWREGTPIPRRMPFVSETGI